MISPDYNKRDKSRDGCVAGASWVFPIGLTAHEALRLPTDC